MSLPRFGNFCISFFFGGVYLLKFHISGNSDRISEISGSDSDCQNRIWIWIESSPLTGDNRCRVRGKNGNLKLQSGELREKTDAIGGCGAKREKQPARTLQFHPIHYSPFLLSAPGSVNPLLLRYLFLQLPFLDAIFIVSIIQYLVIDS